MDILLALIPAFTWGTLLLLSSYFGGKPHHQLIGMTIGALIFALGVFFIKAPELTPVIWVAGALSGVLWSVGQYNQFSSVTYLGVSRTVPISTGMQLFATTAFGVFAFGEWKTTTAVILGIIAIACILIGVIFTVKNDKSSEGNGEQHIRKGLGTLLVSTIGYVGYVIVIRWYNIDGWAVLLPQAIGMFAGAVVFTWKHKPYTRYAFRNIFTGVWWGIGNLGLLISLPRIGVATSFSLSQTGIILSTLGGIYLLGEKKSKRQMAYVIIGCVLIVVGGVMIGLTKE
ncbi:GRP family sugar transporter [Paenibacillus sp. ACRRX]|uniref:GRP family sugar transporter n=1 Tax=Paenibacillus sp. ACRRX TaxID=2918206 RepID=UPI001EF4B31C|nr:GRP family sugar transporter [Paenibacillus sp. ACRRX]MCG7409797.1 GRP family sugar transporter [Paenibacillus sp. ACRRX]